MEEIGKEGVKESRYHTRSKERKKDRRKKQNESMQMNEGNPPITDRWVLLGILRGVIFGVHVVLVVIGIIHHVSTLGEEQSHYCCRNVYKNEGTSLFITTGWVNLSTLLLCGKSKAQKQLSFSP